MARRRLLEPPSDPVNMAAMRATQEDEDEFDATEDEEEFEEDDSSTAEALNDPDVTHLSGGPRIGGGRGKRSEMFGEDAEHAMGRASSPRLYAQAAQFPACVQLRVWKWENGVPVGLGAIDATATEEDFVRQFFSAMPRRGEGRAQFKLRPIDIRGHELGQEVTTVISEHHAAIRRMREAEEEEREMRLYGRGGGRYGRGDDNGSGGQPQVIVEAPPSSDGTEHMGHAMDRMLDVVESRAKALEDALEMERSRVRDEEKQRAQERIDLATNAAQGVQVLTERMMKDDQVRQQQALRAQQEQSQMMLTTLTTIFTQQQSMAAQQAEMQRRADEYRIEQERQRAERERREVEDRLKREREEYEARRAKEREEAEYRLRLEREEAQRKFEQAKMELEVRLQREREEMERKERREREEAERREKWFSEERARREEREAREARDREESRARREQMEREEAREREAERNRQHELRVKEMEAQAQRDREHAERMAAMAKLELEARATAQGGDSLGNTLKMFSQFGIPPEEVFPRVFGMGGKGGGDEEGEEKEAGWTAALPAIMGVLGAVAKAASARGAAQQPRQAPMPPPQFVGGPPMVAPQPPPRMMPRAAQPVRPAPRTLPAPPPEMPQPRVREQQPVLVEDDLPPMPDVAEVEQAMAQAAPPPSLSEVAKAAGLTLKQQKSARIGLRSLVKQMQNAEQEKWEELIGTAIMSEINIFHYVKAVSVKAAMIEAGADEAFAGQVITAMKQSSLVPEDLPYGDENGGEA